VRYACKHRDGREYCYTSQRINDDGQVWESECPCLQFDVTAEGKVVNIVIVESSNSVFDNAAIKAVARFKFKPRVVDGIALVSTGIQNLFTFRLDDL